MEQKKVQGAVSAEVHEQLQETAKELGTTVGTIVAYGVPLALDTLKRSRKARKSISRDGRAVRWDGK